MKKRLAALFLGLVLSLTLLPIVALAGPPALNGTAGENVVWNAEPKANPNITFSGTGPMDDYIFGDSNDWNRYTNATFTIENGITHVGNCAFYRSTCTSATIAASVESIGSFAFSDCASLTTVNIGNPDIVIAETAFQRCGNISSFVVAGKEYKTPEAYLQASGGSSQEDDPLVHYVAPDGTTAIPDNAFLRVESLETVVLPEGVTTIGANAFYQCTNLKSVTLPSTLTTISPLAFSGCTSLRSIQLPNGLQILGDDAFSGCSALTSLTVPKGITSMGTRAFAECTGLTKVTLAQGLTTIGNAAFYNCPGLKSITIPDSMVSIGSFAFRATGLTGVTIPKSVTYLGEYPFGVTNDWEWVTDFTITGYAGTEAETYAKACGFPFVDLTPPSSSKPSYHIHSWGSGVVTLEPTIYTSGLRTYTCSGCGAVRTESISAGSAPPVKGDTVTITGTPNSKGPDSGLRIISSAGINPDAQGGQAYASTQSVEVDGKAVDFGMYALKDSRGNVTNYVKIRDVALMINGTNIQCNVDWLDGYVTVTTNAPYKQNGSEMKTPFTGDRSYRAANAVTVIDGEQVQMQAFILFDDKGGGYTYYKLRDLGQALGFNVGWSSERGVYIETDHLYDPGN